MSSDDAKNILWFVTVPLGIIAIGLVTLSVMRYLKKPEKVIKKIEWLRTFYIWIGALAVLGGTWAFFLPIAINSGFNKNDDGPVLRQLLIYTTGGLLGAITLGETRRKNDQEHMRQVHAERRSRYAKAVEQLADEKAPIRLGGVYTLAKLVDDWLDDEKTLPSEEERREEGQVIINSLCAYIRSPFDLASKTEELSEHKAPENYEGGNQQFIKDQARFREEKELRLTILEAVRNRLNKSTRVHKNGTQKLLPGQWSGFDYDFSNTVFFYPVGFNNSYFGASSNFSGTEFTENTNFSRAKFVENADFSKAEFTKNADFSKAEFSWYTNFSGAKFTGDANFSKAKFISANFSGATFNQGANFSKAIFWTKPIFNDEPYKARFSNKAKLKSDNFQVSHSSPYKIDTDDHRSPDGTITTIPEGCIVFDPKTDKEVPHTPAPNGSV